MLCVLIVMVHKAIVSYGIISRPGLIVANTHGCKLMFSFSDNNVLVDYHIC